MRTLWGRVICMHGGSFLISHWFFLDTDVVGRYVC